MSHLPNIVSLNRPGIIGAPQENGKSPETQDLLGFISQIMPQAQPVAKSIEAAPADVKDLAAKIAGLLLQGEELPESLQNLTPEELSAKIAALLQQNGDLLKTPVTQEKQLTLKIADLLQKEDGIKIKPSLVRDLAALLSPQIQEAEKGAENKEEITAEDIAALLDKVRTDGSNDGAIIKMLQEVQAETGGTASPADILQLLKDKAAELLQTPGGINKEVLVQLKTDIAQSLKDQGMDQPTTEHYLSALAKLLREDETPAQNPVEKAAEKKPAEHKPMILPEIEKTKNNDAPVMTQKAAAADTEKKDHSYRPHQTSEIAPPQQQNTAPKTAGTGINPAMVNALADSNSGFGAEGFGTDGNSSQRQQDILNGGSSLKPLTADALNAKNFTNYLSAARGDASNPATQMVRIQLQHNIAAKTDTMTIQLSPADLGKLDIKLKFFEDGSVKAHLTAEKPETLAMLQRDSHQLEKVLQQSGLSTDEKSLSFDLRQQGQQRDLHSFNDHNKGNAEEFAGHLNGTAAEKTLQTQIAIQAQGYITRSSVNITV